jgi:hypothetical protein
MDSPEEQGLSGESAPEEQQPHFSVSVSQMMMDAMEKPDVDDHQLMIDDISAIEWMMFQAVNQDGPRASCQDDLTTFFAMRQAQFSVWNDASLLSYIEDLRTAMDNQCNLVQEKYINMMASTDPEAYEELRPLASPIDANGERLTDDIVDILMKQNQLLLEKYPHVVANGRPLRARDEAYGATSVETYARGELRTYSNHTLSMLLAHIQNLARKGVNYAEQVLINTVAYYGYASLESAEASAERS